MLREEMEFVRHYFALLQIRFENAVELITTLANKDEEAYLIPPISLQVLVENAIKHNEFSDEYPLNIHVDLNGEEMIIMNEIRSKDTRKASPGTGLSNLRERYELITSKRISVEQIEKKFIVKLPLLKIN